MEFASLLPFRSKTLWNRLYGSLPHSPSVPRTLHISSHTYQLSFASCVGYCSLGEVISLISWICCFSRIHTARSFCHAVTGLHFHISFRSSFGLAQILALVLHCSSHRSPLPSKDGSIFYRSWLSCHLRSLWFLSNSHICQLLLHTSQLIWRIVNQVTSWVFFQVHMSLFIRTQKHSLSLFLAITLSYPWSWFCL